MHPLLIAISLTDLVAALLLLHASWLSGQVVLAWEPGDASAAQLRRERGLELAELEGRAAYRLMLLSSLALVLMITWVLPGVIPGAMCGTGVIEATGGLGLKALGLRAIAVLMLSLWQSISRLDQSRPESPAAKATARALLVAAPLAWLASYHTARGFLGLNTAQAVDCCSVVYDAAAGADPSTGLGVSQAWVTSFAVLSVLVGFGALRMLFKARLGSRGLGLLAWALLWAVVSTEAMRGKLVSYHYEVLAHHCPWCMFLPEHGMLGYPLLLALFVMLSQALNLAASGFFGEKYPLLATEAGRRVQKSAGWVLGALVLYLVLALWPVLRWRLEHGVWIS